jgi:hypothetical protein
MTLNALALTLFSGLALGLASTLHCAGMCGAISCSLLLAQDRGGTHSAQVAFALTHLGRVAAYASAGAVVATAGAPAIAWLDREAAFMLLQWAGAASLIWIGLSTASVLPSLNLLDRGFAAISGGVARAAAASPRREIVPLISGMAWGMMPCAMVYAALFTAMLTGSAVAGAAIMIAFGIGTLPGLIAASFGFRRLAGVARGTGRITAGLVITLFGIATIFIAHPKAAYLCFPARSGQLVTPPTAVWPSARRFDRHQTVQRAADLGSAIIPTPAPANLRDRP